MTSSYDAMSSPDPEYWLDMSESDRMDAVLTYCEANEPDVPNIHSHAAIHTAVETQVAMGSEIPVEATFLRLLGEGLSRHETIHAIGMALSEHLHRLMKSSDPGDDPNIPYYNSLATLTARLWQESGGKPLPRGGKDEKKRKRRSR